MNLETITKPISCLLVSLPGQVYSLPVTSEQLPNETIAQINVEDLVYYTNPIKFDNLLRLKNKIAELEKLNANWDGYGSASLSKKVISNALNFIKTLDESIINDIDEEAVRPTPYGTIVIDIENKNDLLSIEFGENKIGFFTDFEVNQNISSDGENYNPNNLPDSLYKALDKLYSSTISQANSL